MIEVTEVSKFYRDVVALSDVSFTIGTGVTALLGPNGAGKSSLMRIICGLTSPSRGQVRVLGRNPRSESELYRDVGLVPQQESVFERSTCLGFVSACAALQRHPEPEKAAARAIRSVDLDPADRRPLKSFSKGMRQRAKVAQALVHDPKVLVLDEPLSGLDPRQRIEMIQMFRRLGDEGRIVLVSSHVLEEVERLGSRVVVLGQGRLLAEGDFRGIRALLEDRPHRILVRADRPEELAAGLLTEKTVSGARLMGGDALELETDDVTGLRRRIAPVAKRGGIRITEMVPLDEDLDSVFRYLVRK